MAPTAPADLVEWRVFLPTPPAAATAPLSSVLLGELFQAWPVEAEGGVEDRTDRYLLLGSDGVGLKHRGKKGKVRIESVSFVFCLLRSESGGALEWNGRRDSDGK